MKKIDTVAIIKYYPKDKLSISIFYHLNNLIIYPK